MNRHDDMEQTEYDRILGEIVGEQGAGILSVLGVYEILSEHFHDDVLDTWEQGRCLQPLKRLVQGETLLCELEDAHDGPCRRGRVNWFDGVEDEPPEKEHMIDILRQNGKEPVR